MRGSALDPEVVRARLRSEGLDAPEDLIEAYSVADGVKSDAGDVLEDIWVFPGYYWMSLDEAAASHRAFKDDPRWDRSWLPVFASGGGDFYAVSCSGVDRGGVVGYLLGEEEQFIEFPDLGTMFEVLERSFAEGAFYNGPKGFEADYGAMREVAHRIAPGFSEREAHRG
jgi:hypothetical protein